MPGARDRSEENEREMAAEDAGGRPLEMRGKATLARPFSNRAICPVCTPSRTAARTLMFAMSENATSLPPAVLAEEARKHYRLLKIGLLALLALACAFPFTLNLVDPDLWGHVRYGQDWLAAGELPRTATHTYTAVGHPWVNHENAAELLLALSYEHIGIYGMLVAKCLLGMAVLASMVWVASKKGVPAISVGALLLLVSTNLQAFFPMRPQLLSFALCAIALVCLDRAFAGWPDCDRVHFRWLAPLPLVF